MTFLILSGFSGLALAAAPFWVVRVLRPRWKMPKGLFFKAGLALIIIEIIHLAAVGNATSLWPQVTSWPLYLQAIVFGAATGLFMELGRFFVLDRMMKGVRNFRQGVYFGLGWSGVSTALIGLLLIISVFVMYFFSSAVDLAASFPEASPADIEQLQAFREQAEDLMRGNPLFGLSPILERASTGAMDVALTILILICFKAGSTKYVWAAVGLRTIFAGSLIYAASIGNEFAEAVFLLYGLLAFYLIAQMKNSYSAVEGKG